MTVTDAVTVALATPVPSVLTWAYSDGEITHMLTVDRYHNLVAVDEKQVHLTQKKSALLQLLILKAGTVLTKTMTFDGLYGNGGFDPEPKIIEVFICNLRELLRDNAHTLIQTVWGRGYLMTLPDADNSSILKTTGAVKSGSPSIKTPAFVMDVNGFPLTLADLPKTHDRWVIRRKAEVLAAVNGGMLTLETARARYQLGEEELAEWRHLIGRHGLPGLRATHVQEYR